MVYWLFKIVKQTEVPFQIPHMDINKYPVHEHYQYEVKEVFIVYKFKPAKDTDLEGYKRYLERLYKRQYNAYSVEFMKPLSKLEASATQNA